jgi:Ca2+-transporting ATPase
LWTAFRRSNAALWWVAGTTGGILIGIVAFEPARELFHFGALHLDDVAVALASGAVTLVALSLVKRLALSSARRKRGRVKSA